MLNTLSTRSKTKHLHHDPEDDENDIDMSAILNPKLSSTRIERSIRTHAPLPTASPPPPKVTNDYYNKATHYPRPPITTTDTVRSNTTPKGERQHSGIIEKVLAGIPLSDNEIRSVIRRPK